MLFKSADTVLFKENSHTALQNRISHEILD